MEIFAEIRRVSEVVCGSVELSWRVGADRGFLTVSPPIFGRPFSGFRPHARRGLSRPVANAARRDDRPPAAVSPAAYRRGSAHLIRRHSQRSADSARRLTQNTPKSKEIASSSLYAVYLRSINVLNTHATQ